MLILLFVVQLVLAGDPRQLGPILRSVHALRHRLHISLLERLMDLPLYTVPYNPACITKLVRNFRSHEKVSP
jgi:helicase MOV-10